MDLYVKRIKNIVSKWKSQWTQCGYCEDYVTDSNLAVKGVEVHEEHICKECYKEGKDLKW